MVIRFFLSLILLKCVLSQQLDQNSKQPNEYLTSDNYIFICQPIKKINLNKLNLDVDLNNTVLSSNKEFESLLSRNQTIQLRLPLEQLPNSVMKLVSNDLRNDSIADKSADLKDFTKNEIKEESTTELNDLDVQFRSLEAVNETFNKSHSTKTKLDDKKINPIHVKSEQTTPTINFELRDETFTEINDQLNLTNENNNQSNQIRNPEFVTVNPINNQSNQIRNPEFVTVNPIDNQVQNSGSKQLRALNIQKSGLFNSISNQLPKLTNFINGGTVENRPDTKLSLVEDDKLLDESFKMESNEVNPQKSLESPSESYDKSKSLVADNSTIISKPIASNKTTSNQTSTTTSTTEPTFTSSSTLSPELIEQNKIFEEYFPPEQRNTPYIRLMLDSMKQKLGLNKQVVPHHQLEAELSNLKTHLVTSTSNPIASSTTLSATPNQYSTPLPALSTADYSSVQGNPSYISYDEYKKEEEKKTEEIMNKIAKTYSEDKENTETIKKPVKDYSTDKLKGNVNGPVEVDALDVKLPAKSKPKLDYSENDKPEFRNDNLRLGHLTPFNRMPALSRYTKVLTSVSKGFSSLHPGNDRYTGKQNLIPIYGYYRN